MGAAGTPAQQRPDVTIVRPTLSTVVLDRTGGLLGEIGPQARTWVRLVDLPVFVGWAFVAIEDRRFYQHDGVDVIGVVGAIRDNILHGFGSRGASTITQMLVGAMFPEQVDRRRITLGRKLREAELARALERRHSKAEILEAFVNYIHFGHGWYGIEAAARHYFAKHAADLAVHEAALLAAIPNGPALFDPRTRPGPALRRRNLVLRRMRDQGYLTPEAARQAMLQPLRVAPDNGYSVRAPYAVELVRRWLVERFGIHAVNTAGLTVHTTVDPFVQAAADSALREGLARIEASPGYRWPRYGAPGGVSARSATRYLQAALVTLDPASGDVLALIGGRDHRDSEFDRAVQGRRQAGSAFKPFVYAAALAAERPPTILLDDSPLALRLADGTLWRPENSDRTFSGPVTMRTALVRSLNVPTIRLALSVGLDTVVATARRLGVASSLPVVPATAIGAAEVTPLELTSAFGVFATLGAYAPPRVITLVQDSEGVPLYEAPAVQSEQVLDPRVAFQVTDILADAVRRGTGVLAREGVSATLPTAGKTGTTNDNSDVWFVGYTPDLVTGIWLGFDRRQTIAPGAFGGSLAAPIWASWARRVYARRAVPAAWQAPPGLVALRVRGGDGAPAATDSTVGTYVEYFLEGTEPTPAGLARRLWRSLRLGVFGW